MKSILYCVFIFSGKEHHLKKVPDPRKIQALFDDLKKFQEVRQQ